MVETFRSWNLLANVTKQGFPPQGARRIEQHTNASQRQLPFQALLMSGGGWLELALRRILPPRQESVP